MWEKEKQKKFDIKGKKLDFIVINKFADSSLLNAIDHSLFIFRLIHGIISLFITVNLRNQIFLIE